MQSSACNQRAPRAFAEYPNEGERPDRFEQGRNTVSDSIHRSRRDAPAEV